MSVTLKDIKHKDEKEKTRKQIQTLNDRIVLLECQLIESNQKLIETETKLQFGEDEKRRLLHKLSKWVDGL